MVCWKMAAAKVLEDFVRRGAVWLEPTDIPREVYGVIDALCVEATGRPVAEEELSELLAAAT